jgi:hypothetical protein
MRKAKFYGKVLSCATFSNIAKFSLETRINTRGRAAVFKHQYQNYVGSSKKALPRVP